MQNKDSLLTAIQMYDFYLLELQLYLDTHPACQKGLSAYRKYRKLRENAYNIFVEKYGPIVPLDSDAENCFEWAGTPWPWERSDG